MQLTYRDAFWLLIVLTIGWCWWDSRVEAHRHYFEKLHAESKVGSLQTSCAITEKQLRYIHQEIHQALESLDKETRDRVWQARKQARAELDISESL